MEFTESDEESNNSDKSFDISGRFSIQNNEPHIT